MSYCWWKKSCTSWYGYTIIFRVLYIPGGAGFLPSTVPAKLSERRRFLSTSQLVDVDENKILNCIRTCERECCYTLSVAESFWSMTEIFLNTHKQGHWPSVHCHMCRGLKSLWWIWSSQATNAESWFWIYIHNLTDTKDRYLKTYSKVRVLPQHASTTLFFGGDDPGQWRHHPKVGDAFWRCPNTFQLRVPTHDSAGVKDRPSPGKFSEKAPRFVSLFYVCFHGCDRWKETVTNYIKMYDK